MSKPKKQNQLMLWASQLSWKFWCSLLSGLGLFWWLFVYSPYPKTPIIIPFEIGKKGAVVETDFTIPYTFDLGYNYYEISIAFVDTVDGRFKKDLDRKSEELISSGNRYFTTMERVVGVSKPRSQGSNDQEMYLEGFEFLVKMTLTPHAYVSSPLVYILGSENGRWNRQELENASQSLEIVVDMSGYGPHSSRMQGAVTKPIIHIDPRYGGSYEIKIESLRDLPLPKGFEAKLVVLDGLSVK